MILSGEDVLNGMLRVNIEDSPKIPTQDDHVTSAPKAVRVSIRTAVWIVLKRGRLEIKRGVEDCVIHVKTAHDTGTGQRLGRAILQTLMSHVEQYITSRWVTLARMYMSPGISCCNGT